MKAARSRWLLSPLVLVTTVSAQQEPPSVTLAEAIALAARHDPNVIQAQGSVRSAGAGVRSALGSFLPAISGNASGGNSFFAGPSRTDPITGEVLGGDQSSTSANFGLSASIDLFTGFRRGADLRAARGREDESEAALRAAQAQSALQTSNDFFSALRSREVVAVRRESVRRGEEQLAIATARLATRAAVRVGPWPGGGIRYDVFDPAGAWLGAVHVPVVHSPWQGVAIGADYFVAPIEDEDGRPAIVRYRIEKAPAT